MGYLLCWLNLLALLVYWTRRGEAGLRRIYFTLFVSCYVFTYFGGVLLASALFAVLGIEKIAASDAVTLEVILISELGLGLFLAGYGLASPVRRFIPQRTGMDWRRGTGWTVAALAAVFCVAMAVYVVGAGGPVLFREGGYENRYDANLGMGGYSLFFPMGLVACTLIALRAQSGAQKRTATLVTVLYCALTFVVLGGYRQLGFAALFSIGVIALLRRDLSYRRFLVLCAVLIVSTLAVAIFRYTGTTDDESGGLAGRLFIFLYDGFAPVDAFYNIVEFGRNHAVPVNVLANQFMTAVPRWAWPDKPLVVLNAGNFYTQNILRRADAITYSPTLLGELYLLGGVWGCAAGAFVSGVALRVFDEIVLRSRNRSRVVFLFSFAFVLVFNLYREGFGVLATKLLLYGGVFAVLLFLARLASGRVVWRVRKRY